MTKVVSPPPDTVSEVLRSYGVRSTIFCLSELRTPWAFRVEGEPVAKFHLVLEGSALLFSEAGSVTLAAGDLAVLPHGSAHTLADDRDSRAAAAPLERLLARLRCGRWVTVSLRRGRSADEAALRRVRARRGHPRPDAGLLAGTASYRVRP